MVLVANVAPSLASCEDVVLGGCAAAVVDVCTSRRGAALAGAVERMTKLHIGAIVVVEESDR
jgi:hypothetical protein